MEIIVPKFFKGRFEDDEDFMEFLKYAINQGRRKFKCIIRERGIDIYDIKDLNESILRLHLSREGNRGSAIRFTGTSIEWKKNEGYIKRKIERGLEEFKDLIRHKRTLASKALMTNTGRKLGLERDLMRYI